MKYLLGIDVSTTATKSVLVDTSGAVIGSAAVEYGFETPQALWSEQDPNLWWDGAVHSIRVLFSELGILPTDIAGIGLTGQMHGLVLLDEAGEILRPAILWNDQRTEHECREIRRRIGQERFLKISGNEVLTGFTAPKILWVQKHEPEIYARAAHVLLPKDYVRFKLTGEYALDKADGAGTVLMDIRSRDWSVEILNALGIPSGWMPALYEGPEITGVLNHQAAQETGLLAGTPVVAGGGDQSAQAVGVGAVETGIVALTLGTSGVVFAGLDEPVIEPQGRLHAFCHAVPGKWHLMGVMLSAGGSLRWFRDAFSPEQSFPDLLGPAADVNPGAGGLYFLPYLTGERTPHPDPHARAAFVGLTVRHKMPDLTLAVLEGVAFGLKDCFNLMLSAGLPEIKQVRISGGGARSPIWRQIIADVLGIELVTTNTTEGAAYGAALLAGVGIEIWPDVASACAAVIWTADRTTVHSESSEQYHAIYDTYRSIYPALRPIFNNIHEQQGG
jgi:xylulokinase